LYTVSCTYCRSTSAFCRLGGGVA